MSILAIDCGLHACAWTRIGINDGSIIEQNAIDFMPKKVAPKLSDFAQKVQQLLPPAGDAKYIIIEEQQNLGRVKPNKYCVAMQHFALFHYANELSSDEKSEVLIVPASSKFKMRPVKKERDAMAMKEYTGGKDKLSKYASNKYYAKSEFANKKMLNSKKDRNEFCRKLGISISAFGDISDSWLLAESFRIHHNCHI